MEAKTVLNFLKPNILKIIISLIIAIIFLYFPAEKACGAGFGFSFCYKDYGFPFKYLITGDADFASQFTGDYALGKYFRKYENFLLNSLSLAIDLALAYLLACSIDMATRKIKSKI